MPRDFNAAQSGAVDAHRQNRLYAEIKNGNIEAYVYKGGYILTKDAVIDYLIRTTPDTGKRFTIGGGYGDQ